MTWDELRAALAVPFPAEMVKFRPGSTSGDKKRAQALAYAEPRVYEDRLNEVLGPAWACRFIPWGDQRLLCELTITLQDDAGGVQELVRTSTGEFDSGDTIAKGTSAEAQAFKRACSKFGLGRYLYDLPVVWVGYDANNRRLTEIPGIPERFLPQPEPVTPPEPVRLTSSRASQLAPGTGQTAHHRLKRAFANRRRRTRSRGRKLYRTDRTRGPGGVEPRPQSRRQTLRRAPRQPRAEGRRAGECAPERVRCWWE